MATTKTEKNEIKEERRDIYIERDSRNDDPNYFISINGRSFLLPRGKVSNVPAYVADEIERIQRSQMRYDETIDRLKSMAK